MRAALVKLLSCAIYQITLANKTTKTQASM